MDIDEWNRRLVKAVFHDRVDLAPEIRRISATDSFLAEAGGFVSGADARRSFIAAMPHTEYGMRSLFSWSVANGWSIDHDDLPFYAQLHLSILAASADETSKDEGNFRLRLSRLLGLGYYNWSMGDLPWLWERASEWSVKRAIREGDTRILVLPNPGREKIIGFSKRLAFPGYLDQKHLAELLASNDLDASSPISHLMQAFYTNKYDFTPLFREQFDRFARFIEAGDSEGALESPFWDVVLETTWTSERRSQSRSTIACRLEVDPTNPHDLGLWVYCRSGGKCVSGWHKEPDDILAPGLVRWMHDECRPGAIISLLWSLADDGRHSQLLGSDLERGLSEGCIGFGQDDDGRWLDIHRLPEAGRVWLILHRDNDWLLEAPTGGYTNSATYKVRLPGDPEWILFGPIDVDEQSRRWFEEEAGLLEFFAPRLARRTISVMGSIRRADGAYLFLPPVIPAFRCAGARSGVAKVEEKDGGPTIQLVLHDDLLNLPADMVIEGGRDLSMRVIANDAEGKQIAQRRVELRDVSSAHVFKGVRRPDAWLESGADGCLRPYSPGPALEHPQPNVSGGSADIRPLFESDSSAASPVLTDVQEVDERWLRALEISSALFARRYAYPVGEYLELLQSIWGRDVNAWGRFEDFVENGFLRLLYARHWSSRVVTARQPTVVVHECSGGITLRIVGLLSMAMRANIERILGVKSHVIASPDRLFLGATECQPNTKNDVEALLAETGWATVPWGEIPAVVLPRFDDIIGRPVRENLDGFSDDQKTVWDHRRGFIVRTDSMVASPRLERWRTGNIPDLFVLLRGGGQVWNTDCRKWALIALVAETGTGLGSVYDDGSVCLEDARITLPAPLAWYAVAGGGGVCFVIPGAGRLYTAGDFWKPADACGDWIQTVDMTDRGRRCRTAKERYTLLVSRQKKYRRNMMRHMN